MMRAVEVLLGGRLIGSLAEDDHERWQFRFSKAYRRLNDRPLLGQFFEDDLRGTYRGKKGALPPYFANLIPETSGELRPLLEAQLEIARGDDITLLERLGRDLPGAVEVRQIAELPHEHAVGLDDGIGPTEPSERDEEWIRFSLAGFQLKFSVLLAKEKITLPMHGSRGDWLIKLDSERFPGLCANEHAVMLWAKTAGFTVPEIRLMPSSALLGKLGEYAEPDTYVLAVKRYDREPQGKIHQEDFAQVANLSPEHKYDQKTYEWIARIASACVGGSAANEIIRRLVLMIASGNVDAHLKNWSFIYPDGIRAELSPLYDQVATVAWPQLKRKLALKFAGVKELSKIGREDFSRLADRARFPREEVLAVVNRTLGELAEAWKSVSKSPEWSMSPAHMKALHEHWQRTPLLREVFS
ncbi:MAG TPA: type II toxin-antitoxin system HipA family toxin, partial [Nannocystis exedens]|nr:type II toxin-antitoxin system HipA family toxin [Nannocystis exedens]